MMKGWQLEDKAKCPSEVIGFTVYGGHGVGAFSWQHRDMWGFPKMRIPFWGPHHKHYNIFVCGSPALGKLPYVFLYIP